MPASPVHPNPSSSPPLQTLCCANTQHDQFVQVTATQVRLVDALTHQLAAQWESGAAGRITIASASPTQVGAARAKQAVSSYWHCRPLSHCSRSGPQCASRGRSWQSPLRSLCPQPRACAAGNASAWLSVCPMAAPSWPHAPELTSARLLTCPQNFLFFFPAAGAGCRRAHPDLFRAGRRADYREGPPDAGFGHRLLGHHPRRCAQQSQAWLAAGQRCQAPLGRHSLSAGIGHVTPPSCWHQLLAALPWQSVKPGRARQEPARLVGPAHPTEPAAALPVQGRARSAPRPWLWALGAWRRISTRCPRCASCSRRRSPPTSSRAGERSGLGC